MIASLIITMLASAAPAGTIDPSAHVVNLDRAGSSFEARYRGSVEIRMRDIGMSPPNRPSTARCLWSGVVHVSRDLARSGARSSDGLGSRIASRAFVSGQRPVGCREARGAIAGDIARAGGRAHEALIASARADRPALEIALTELIDGSRASAD